MTEDNSSQYLLGGMSVNCGYLTKEQYEQSYYDHVQNSPDIPYSDYLVANGYMTQEQVTYVQQVMAGGQPAEPVQEAAPAPAEDPLAAVPMPPEDDMGAEPAPGPGPADFSEVPLPPEEDMTAEPAAVDPLASVPLPPEEGPVPGQEETGVGFDTPMPAAAPAPPQEETGVGFDTPMPPDEPAAAPSANLSPELPSAPPAPPVSAEPEPEMDFAAELPEDEPEVPAMDMPDASEPAPAINKPFASSFGSDDETDGFSDDGGMPERKVLSIENEEDTAPPAVPEAPAAPAEVPVMETPPPVPAPEPEESETLEAITGTEEASDEDDEEEEGGHANLILADIVLTNPENPDASPVECKALVSTGVLQLCLPSDIISQLGLSSAGETEITSIDGSRHVYRVFGPVSCACGPADCTLAAVELPFRAQPVLGITPLREMGLNVSLKDCTLI